MSYELRYEGWSQRHGANKDGLVVFVGLWEGRHPLSSAAAYLSPSAVAVLADELPKERLIAALAAVGAELLEGHVRRLGTEGDLPPQIGLHLDRFPDRIRAAGQAEDASVRQGSVLRVFDL